MRYLLHVLVSLLAFSSLPVSATPICARLLAVPINPARLRQLARASAFGERLAEAWTQALACRARIATRQPDINGVVDELETLRGASTRWEKALEVVLPGVPLSKRALTAVSADQRRRDLERPQQADAWTLKDLDREVQATVFGELQTHDGYYRNLINARDGYENLVRSGEVMVAKITAVRQSVKDQRLQEQANEYSDVASVHREVTELNELLNLFFKAAVVLELARGPVKVGVPLTGLGAMDERLGEATAEVHCVSEAAEQTRTRLDARVREIAAIVCAQVAAKPEKSTSSPPRAE